MIRIFITALIYLIGLFTQAQEPSQPDLEQSIATKSTMNAIVSNIKDSKASVDATFYIVEADFVNRTYFQTKHIKGDENRLTMAFENAPFSVYDLSNDRDKKDKGIREFDINARPD